MVILMSKIIKLGLSALMVAFLLLFGLTAFADQYPGVYAGEDKLVFIKGSDPQGSLEGVVVLSYEYSMDWLITTAKLGAKIETGILLTDGKQYVYSADGKRRSESEFNSMILDFEWNSLEFSILPSYGRFLAPMVKGGLAYALIDLNAGLPSQLVLAREVLETTEIVHLFDGFMYQISDGKLSAQISFTEVAFGSQGLVRAKFPENFPPPPENYPSPYPIYSTPGYPVPKVHSDSSLFSDSSSGSSLPSGREIPPEEQIKKPSFKLEPMHDYDVAPIVKIGVISTQLKTDVEGYEVVVDDLLQKHLSQIDGVEPVYIPYDSSKFGGAVMYDRAVWLCQNYGVDAFLMTELHKIEVTGEGAAGRLSKTARVSVTIKSRLIEGSGGSIWWSYKAEESRVHDYYEIEQGRDSVLRTNIMRAVKSLIEDLKSSGKLQGGHVD